MLTTSAINAFVTPLVTMTVPACLILTLTLTLTLALPSYEP